MGLNNSLGSYVTYAGEGLAAMATAGAVALTAAGVIDSDSTLTYHGIMQTLGYGGVVVFFSELRGCRKARAGLEEALEELKVVSAKI